MKIINRTFLKNIGANGMFKGVYIFETFIQKNDEEVWNFFLLNENIIKITTFPKLNFSGDKYLSEGATFNLKLKFPLVSLSWKGKIIKVKNKMFFTDAAVNLPFPLKGWHHTHTFERINEHETKIIDKVVFHSYVPSFIVKIALYQMFSSRKKQLKKYLNNN